MKTVEIGDEAFEILTEIAQRSGSNTVAAYIESLPEIRAELKRRNERKIIDAIDEKKISRKDLNEKFIISIYLIYKTDPKAFERLEGFTKPSGQAVFISRSEEKIKNTSQSARPVRLGETGFYVNVQGGQTDYEYLIDLICGHLGFSPSIPAALKKRVIRSKFDFGALLDLE